MVAQSRNRLFLIVIPGHHDGVEALVVDALGDDEDVVELDVVEGEVRAADQRALLVGHVADLAVLEGRVIAVALEGCAAGRLVEPASTSSPSKVTLLARLWSW